MRLAIFLVLLGLVTSCSSLGPGVDFEEQRVIEPTAKFHLAIGGVAPGRDELVIYDGDELKEFAEGELECTSSSKKVQLKKRPDFDSVSAGSGVRIVPSGVGIAAITCTEGGLPIGNPYEVIVPAQSVVQILLAEAGNQIVDEATYDQDFVVALDSRSATAEALAYVIQNRVAMAQEYDQPGLFSAGYDDFYDDPPLSYYDSIIEAPNQFSPLDPDDPTNEVYDDAQDRNFLDEQDWRVAYDQAVLSAAAVYAEDIDDPTGGAFGFRSPNEEQWAALEEALLTEAGQLPADGGVTDNAFPILKPLQVLILPDVWTYDDGRPSFIFIRKRGAFDPAVTDIP